MSIYLKEPLNKSPETAKIIRDKLPRDAREAI
jgi:hypothetical protein